MSSRLTVDPIACTGHGLCAELFPERVELDDWGYPILRDDRVPDALLPHARRAVAACPTLALRLEREARERERERASRTGAPRGTTRSGAATHADPRSSVAGSGRSAAR